MRHTKGIKPQRKEPRLPEIPGEVYTEFVDVMSDREYRACMAEILRMRRERLDAFNAERVANGLEPITGYESGSGE